MGEIQDFYWKFKDLTDRLPALCTQTKNSTAYPFLSKKMVTKPCPKKKTCDRGRVLGHSQGYALGIHDMERAKFTFYIPSGRLIAISLFCSTSKSHSFTPRRSQLDNLSMPSVQIISSHVVFDTDAALWTPTKLYCWIERHYLASLAIATSLQHIKLKGQAASMIWERVQLESSFRVYFFKMSVHHPMEIGLWAAIDLNNWSCVAGGFSLLRREDSADF